LLWYRARVDWDYYGGARRPQCPVRGAARGAVRVRYTAGSPRPRLSRSRVSGSVRSGIEQATARRAPAVRGSTSFDVGAPRRRAWTPEPGRRAINITHNPRNRRHHAIAVLPETRTHIRSTRRTQMSSSLAQMPHAFSMRAGQSGRDTFTSAMAHAHECARSTAILLTLPPYSFEYFPSSPPSPWGRTRRFEPCGRPMCTGSPSCSLGPPALWHACSRRAQDGV
jgi:hypothetical protein